MIRRTRAVARGALRKVDTHNDDIDERMQSIARHRASVLESQQEINRLEGEVEALMKEAKQEEHECMGLVAHFIETKSNASTYVDPMKLRKVLKDDKEFYACVKVQTGELKTFLSEKEIANIAQVTPGKVTGTKFEIIQPKTAVGKGGRK
jgi:hypothetical protein